MNRTGGRVVRPLPEWTESERAWLAGLLEGEGTFDLKRANGSHQAAWRVRLGMTDEDIVLRAAGLMNASVQSRPGYLTHYQPVYSLVVTGSKALEIMRRLLPLMGARRGARIVEALSA